MTEMPAIVRAHEQAGRYVEVEGARIFVREHFVDGRHFLSEDQPEELAAHVAALVREVTR
jgi:hypothetical protein